MPRRPGEAYLQKAKQKATREYNATRPERHKFYHTKRWKNLRDYVMARSPLCAECLKHGVITAGQLVGHIIPIADGGAEMDIENLQVLCEACHNRKHAGEGEVKSLGPAPGAAAAPLLCPSP